MVGEGVLSFCDWWKPPFVGLKTLTAWYEAAEVSIGTRGQRSAFGSIDDHWHRVGSTHVC